MCIRDSIEDARMVRANVRRGSGNIAHGPAMSRDGAVRAIEVGIAVACGLARAGVRLLAAGEMGIGNTTTSAAVAAVLLRADARSLVGRGAGLSDASLARKRDVVERAIDANSPDPADPIDVLSKVGGFDIAAMCGFYLGAAASKAPALLDGVISCTAALCAARLCPNVLGYLVGTHASSEPASQELLRELGIKAVSYTHLDVYKRQGIGRFHAKGNDHRGGARKPRLALARGARRDRHRRRGHRRSSRACRHRRAEMCIRDSLRILRHHEEALPVRNADKPQAAASSSCSS